MSRVTVYRTDVDSPRLARLLGKVPGVAVGGQEDETATPDDETGDDDTVAPTAPADDDGGLGEQAPVPNTDEDGASVVKTYGLLGLGVSMVVLGIATVGIWVYRRRTGDGEAETPPPSTGVDTTEPTSTVPGPSTAETELSTAESETDAASSTPGPSLVRPDEEADDESEKPSERPGRAEGDRSEVEWATKDRTPASESDEATAESDEDDAAEPEAETRPGESIDAAPLLGVAFVAVTGAVVRWLRSGTEDA